MLLGAVLLLSGTACAPDVYRQRQNDDPAIKAQVVRKLRSVSPEVDLSKVDVDVHVGVVTLSGLVATDDERDSLRDAARRVSGVQQVVVNLLVQQ